MGSGFDILDENILKLINERLAKPDKTIRKHTEELIESLQLLLEIGYIKKDKIYELVEKACIYHDIGKINNEFQKRVKDKEIKFNDEKEIAHNILSLYFIDKGNFKSEEDYLKVVNAVLNHHDYCNVFEVLKDQEELIRELLRDFKTVKVKRSIKNKLADEKLITDKESILIKGYLHKCDYSASSGIITEYKNDFLEDSLKKLLSKWKVSNEKACWNELQEYCIEHKNENIIAIAQTGMGKTEAGLLWIGDTKGFFVLPIRTAINAIYDRVRNEIIRNIKIDERIAILHSSSLEYYFNNLNKEIDEIDKIDLLNYYSIGKQLSIPLNITTMDQIFDFVYKYPGYELKLTTLSYSKIVVDEIQAYSADLLAYLIYGLERVVEVGGKVAIVTATLPPFIKDLLKKKINFVESEKPFTDDSRRHNLKIIDKRINAKDIYNKYYENKKLNKSNKILVVCNTIKDAQRIYKELENEYNLNFEEDINILHSKFIRAHRLKKEQEIIEFGKTFNKNKELDNQSGIWISTSIVEASLDIDFDYLFTELQDLTSLFQRLGRCNRKGVKDSNEYNCYIYTEIDEGLLINGDKGFIDKKMYELSKDAIINIDGQISEMEKVELINSYLTTENLAISNYMRSYREIYNLIAELIPSTFKKNEIKLRNILSEEIIPSPIYVDNLEDITKIEDKLQEKGLSHIERIKLRDEIRKYTVSIQKYEVNNYEKAKNTGKAIYYRPIKLSNNSKDIIKVIECEYTEIGYNRMKYDKDTRGGEFF